MIRIWVLLAIFFIFSGISLGGTIDPSNKDSDYIHYGQNSYYIGQIIGLTHDNEPYYGSGVAYQDNIILTAAHVLNATKSQEFIINNSKFKIIKFIIHNKYNHNTFGYYDIAIAKLDNKIGFEWYPSLYEKRDEVGKICSLSGFGMTGSFATGAVISDKNKRAGSNMIDSVDRGLLTCTPSIKFNKTSLEFIIAPGDSGGGLFIDNQLAGIHSCVMAIGKKANSGYGTESGHTRISDHVTWIRNSHKLLEE